VKRRGKKESEKMEMEKKYEKGENFTIKFIFMEMFMSL
jgi:hypothetical protein